MEPNPLDNLVCHKVERIELEKDRDMADLICSCGERTNVPGATLKHLMDLARAIL
jgi:hypothetical protein